MRRSRCRLTAARIRSKTDRIAGVFASASSCTYFRG